MAGGRTEDAAEHGMPVRPKGKSREMSLAMPAHPFHDVQAFEERDGGIVYVESGSLPICRLRPRVGWPIPNSVTGVPPGPVSSLMNTRQSAA
jgi:hypothetical protein